MFLKKILSGVIAGSLLITAPVASHAGLIGKTFKVAVIEGVEPEVSANKIEENARYAQLITTEMNRAKDKNGIYKVLEHNKKRLAVGNDGFF